MAKKRKQATEERQRQSRKDILIARRQEQQTRRVRLLVLAVVALILVVLIIGVVNEVFLRPSRPVAIVKGVEIPLGEWREQVEYRRALLVRSIDELAGLVGGDYSQIEQFARQELQELGDPVLLGQQVLEQMIDQELVRQEAALRGILVSEAEVHKELEESLSYFGGRSPTPQPTATETTVPTPSITPIILVAITDTIDIVEPSPTSTAGPTNTPMPTPTAVSLESYQESLANWYGSLDDYGVGEELFLRQVEQELVRQKLIEAMAEVEVVDDEAEQASIFYLRFDNEAEAEAARDDIQVSDYLTIWNTIGSREDDGQTELTAFAGELVWRTADNIEGIFGQEIGEIAFDIGIEEPSEIVIVPAATEDGVDSYYIIMVSGRELRPLTQSAIDNAKLQLLTDWLEQVRLQGVDIFERWRVAVPSRPVPDSSFWFVPTPVPTPTPADSLGLTPVPTPGE